MHSLINTNHIRSAFHVCTRKAKIRTILHLIAYILYCGFQAVKCQFSELPIVGFVGSGTVRSKTSSSRDDSSGTFRSKFRTGLFAPK